MGLPHKPRPNGVHPERDGDRRRTIAVPDAAVDPFRLVVANAGTAMEYGARIETHARVEDLLVEDGEVVGLAVEHGATLGGRAYGVGKSCSGISGTEGWKAEKYDVSKGIGEEMFEHVADAQAETGLTECPTSAMQMEHVTGYQIRHPLEVLESAPVDAGAD